MTSMNTSEIFYKPVTNVDEAYEIEILGYPPDEAATLEKLKYRQLNAPNLFIGAFINTSNNANPKLIGFITSTQSDSNLVTEEAMSSHDPSGKAVCIHSVCTHPDFRGKGIASKLIKHYIEWIRKLKSEGVLRVDRICLMSRAKLSDWYSKLGFEYIGKSEVQHGTEQWNDHILLL